MTITGKRDNHSMTGEAAVNERSPACGPCFGAPTDLLSRRWSQWKETVPRAVGVTQAAGFICLAPRQRRLIILLGCNAGTMGLSAT